jgi:twitching motility protein PilT
LPQLTLPAAVAAKAQPTAGATASVSGQVSEKTLHALANRVLAARTTPTEELASTAPAEPVTPQLETMTFLRMAVAQEISDIHFRLGYPPIVRKNGEMMYTNLPALTEAALEQFLEEAVPPEYIEKLQGKTDFDFSFEIAGIARFRVNWLYEFNRVALVLRIVKTAIPTLEQLGLPATLRDFTTCSKGLVLVTGPTGSGKSTTLAAILNEINLNQPKHIVTLEDPIEYAHKSKRAVVTQRQLGMDVDSFPNGIKFSLRQDPDVILVGEMRDRETVNAALHAAETGHMVFSTLHTVDSVQTINRVINLFEPHEREQIRHQLASILQGIVSQRLVRKIDGTGRTCVYEILKVTPAVRDYISRYELAEIYPLLDSNEFQGSISMNKCLYNAYKNKDITYEDALDMAENKTEMEQMLRGYFMGTR